MGCPENVVVLLVVILFFNIAIPVLAQTGVAPCTPSEANVVPFRVRTILELQRQGSCSQALSQEETVTLEASWVRAYYAAMSDGVNLNLCDPLQRNIETAIVMEEDEIGTFDTSSNILTLVLEVTGTFICTDQNRNSIEDSTSSTPSTCSFFELFDQLFTEHDPVDGECDPCSLAVADEAQPLRRGPTEAEFVRSLRTLLDNDPTFDTLSCATQVGDCQETRFETTLLMSFSDLDIEEARSRREEIELQTFLVVQQLFGSGGDPTTCFADFRRFQQVQVIFKDEDRRDNRRFLQTMDGFSEENPAQNSSIPMANSTLHMDEGNNPTAAPTIAVFHSHLTAIIRVTGFCAGCPNELFFGDAVSGRRILQGEQPRQSFNEGLMQDTPSSNCFCPASSRPAVLPTIEECAALIQERLGLPIVSYKEIGQREADDHLSNNPSVFRFQCTNVTTTFQRTVPIEVWGLCGSTLADAEELTNSDLEAIADAYVAGYTATASEVCDPFLRRITGARVASVGERRGNDIPLELEISMDCFGCDPNETQIIYGFASSLTLPAPANMSSATAANWFTCGCNAGLPRRAPVESEVKDRMLSNNQVRSICGLLLEHETSQAVDLRYAALTLHFIVDSLIFFFFF